VEARKAALEYLWWRGDLTVAARVHFHKVYDLTARCFPDLVAEDPPDEASFVGWACRAALERLGVATPREIAGFFGAVSLAEARAWCRHAVPKKTIVALCASARDGEGPREAFALPDWRRRLARARLALAGEETRGRFRLLSPFDPLVRDRARLERLFGFAYRFEAFVPAARRRYGYYVLPVLEGERFVARVDLKHHRDRSTLEARGRWWEPGRGSRQDEARLGEALARLATFVGAERVQTPRGRGAPRTGVSGRRARRS